MTDRASPTARRGRSHARFVMPVLAAGIIVACLTVLLKPESKPYTVSSVARDISRVALHKSQRPGVEDGGIVGAWWISASAYDPVGAEFHNLVIKSGPIIVAARKARLSVDPVADTFSFEMTDVVYTRLPGTARDPDAEGTMERLESLRLGPVQYGRDIVPDGGMGGHDDAGPADSIANAG